MTAYGIGTGVADQSGVRNVSGELLAEGYSHSKPGHDSRVLRELLVFVVDLQVFIGFGSEFSADFAPASYKLYRKFVPVFHCISS